MANDKNKIPEIKIADRTFIFKLDKLQEFLAGTMAQKETTVAYDLEENSNSPISNRVVRELETNDKSFTANLVYDFIKLLAVTVLEWPMLTGYQPAPGVTIALGTLLEYKLLEEVKD